MEISLLPKGGIRIKGKQATIVAGGFDTSGNVNAVLLFHQDTTYDTVKDSVLVIDGPGDFEVGSVKISTFRSGTDLVHSLGVDGIEVLVGKTAPVERMLTKLSEHQIVTLFADTALDASFANTITTNVLLIYGENGKEVAQKAAKSSVQEMSKYSVTIDKLPAEVETILLTS